MKSEIPNRLVGRRRRKIDHVPSHGRADRGSNRSGIKTHGSRLNRHHAAPPREPLLPPTETQGISGILPPEFNGESVEHFCENEWAIHLDDVMIRRTSWHYYHKDAAARASLVAAWMKEFLSWADDDLAKEIARYRELTR